jgi:hypothetical protein
MDMKVHYGKVKCGWTGCRIKFYLSPKEQELNENSIAKAFGGVVIWYCPLHKAVFRIRYEVANKVAKDLKLKIKNPNPSSYLEEIFTLARTKAGKYLDAYEYIKKESYRLAEKSLEVKSNA